MHLIYIVNCTGVASSSLLSDATSCRTASHSALTPQPSPCTCTSAGMVSVVCDVVVLTVWIKSNFILIDSLNNHHFV